MDHSLAGKTVAIVLANGFAETQLTSPQKALIAAGAKVKVISPEQGLVNGWHETSWGHYFPVDEPIETALGSDFDTLLLPGGKRSVGKLVQTEHTARIIRSFFDAGKPVAAIGDGVGLIAFAERLEGRTVTGEEEIRDAAEKAGATWQGEDQIVEDGLLLTGQGPDVLEEFTERVLRFFGGEQAIQDAA